MTKRLFTAVALIGAFASTVAHWTLDAMASGTGNPLEPGTYLSRDYIDILKRSKSPFKADGEANHIYKLVSVRYDRGKGYLTPETFHEGGLSYVLSPNATLEPSDPSYPRPTHFKVNSAHSFELSFSPERPVRYEKVGNVASYVSAVTLVGRYTDSAGRMYQFRSDGKAIFPDREFTYEVGLDHVLTHFDYFYEAGKVNEVTPYQRDDETLRLYTIKKQENLDVMEIDSTKPPLILHAIKSSK